MKKNIKSSSPTSSPNIGRFASKGGTELERRRHEVDRHIADLNAGELKELWTQVSFGSMYLSDYRNSFDISEEEVCEYCEHVLDECDQHSYTNTPDMFAKIIMEEV